MPGWEGLASLARVQTSSVERGRETRYYISSVKNPRAEQAYDLARGHWGVENKLHWQLDVTLGEDGKRNRKDSSAENLPLLRKILLNTAQLNEPKLSKKRIIKKMTWNSDYCLQMLAKIIAK
jgi:predicted transposase YbfD/YdcC